MSLESIAQYVGIIFNRNIMMFRFLSVAMTRSFVRNQNINNKDVSLPFTEAMSLQTIDRCVEHLINVMNCVPLIKTIGSSQGYGHAFIKVSPYVSFKSNINVASAIATALRDDYYSSSRKLNYYWELSAYFDLNSELTYLINIPGISSGKCSYATKYGIDQDFNSIGLFVQEVLDRFKNQDIVIKREESSYDKNNPHENGTKKAHQKKIKHLLHKLVAQLENKWACGYGEETLWSYRDAAHEFHDLTGCKYNSAENYFKLIEAIAEWESLSGPRTCWGIKEALKHNGILYGRPRAFPLLPDARST